MDKAPVILLVEDEVLIRMLAAEILSEAGFTVIESASADEALTILQARSDVQLLFTDVNMPGSLDGLALGRPTENRSLMGE
jgi:CheY-like chemotaxis protein